MIPLHYMRFEHSAFCNIFLRSLCMNKHESDSSPCQPYQPIPELPPSIGRHASEVIGAPAIGTLTAAFRSVTPSAPSASNEVIYDGLSCVTAG